MAHDDDRNDGNPDPAGTSADTQTGVPAGAAQEESHGGYGGTDRLQSEAGPLQPKSNGPSEGVKEQGKDI